MGGYDKFLRAAVRVPSTVILPSPTRSVVLPPNRELPTPTTPLSPVPPFSHVTPDHKVVTRATQMNVRVSREARCRERLPAPERCDPGRVADRRGAGRADGFAEVVEDARERR